MSHTEFLNTLKDSLSTLPVCPGDAHIAYETLVSILEGGGGTDEYFSNFRGAGSYKEAWQIGSLCVKFAAAAPVILNEITAYNNAHNYEISHIFCPTVFLRLPEDIHLILTEMPEEKVFEGDSRFNATGITGSCWASPRAAYLILQPIVGLIDDLTRPLSPNSYYTAPIILKDGTTLSFEEYNALDAPLEWREAIITKYGDVGYRDISFALNRLNVHDLHQGNVGWLDDTPVILDWLSSAPI